MAADSNAAASTQTADVSNDGVFLLIIAVTAGFAWLGGLCLVALVTHCLRGTKGIDVDRFLNQAVRLGVIACAALVTLMVLIWMIWKWKPDLGFWGRFIHSYWRLTEAGILIGVTGITAVLASLRRRKRRKS